MNKEFCRLIRHDPLTRAFYEAWRNGQFRSFEDMLVDLVIAQSMARESLGEALIKAEERRPNVFFVEGGLCRKSE